MSDPTADTTAVKSPAREGWLAKALVVALLALGAVFFGLTWWTDAKALKAGALAVDEKDLDFGEIWESGDFTWAFPVRNVSGRTVEIAEFDSNCDCLKVEPPSLLLGPDEVRICRAKLRIAGRPGGATSLAPRPFATLITPILKADAGLGQPSWKVHGVVRPVALLKPAISYFDELSSQDEGVRRECVQATTAEPVRWSVRCDPDVVRASAIRSKTDPLVSTIVVIPRAAILPSGPFSTTVQLIARTDEGKELPPVHLTVEGVVIEAVQAVPANVPFGAQPLGGRGSETVVLRSRRKSPFRVEKIEEGPGVAVQPEKIEGANEKTYRLTRRFTATGFQAGEVRFYVRAEGEPLVKVAVPWSYYGVQK